MSDKPAARPVRVLVTGFEVSQSLRVIIPLPALAVRSAETLYTPLCVVPKQQTRTRHRTTLRSYVVELSWPSVFVAWTLTRRVPNSTSLFLAFLASLRALEPLVDRLNLTTQSREFC